MPNYGDTQDIDVWKDCPNGAQVKCTQKQVYQRVWYKLWFGGAWFNDGAPVCPPCPTGPQPKTSVIRIRCFLGAYVAAPGPTSPPGPLGLLPALSFIFGPMPPGMLIRPIGSAYLDLNAEASQMVLEMMRKALEILRNMGSLNEAQTQEAAIKCFEAICKEFGWL